MFSIVDDEVEGKGVLLEVGVVGGASNVGVGVVGGASIVGVGVAGDASNVEVGVVVEMTVVRAMKEDLEEEENEMVKVLVSLLEQLKLKVKGVVTLLEQPG